MSWIFSLYLPPTSLSFPQAGTLGVLSHTEAILKFAKYLVSQKVPSIVGGIV